MGKLGGEPMRGGVAAPDGPTLSAVNPNYGPGRALGQLN